MSTQQDIYAAGSENRPHMLNKDNYVPWSSRLLRYAKSRPNGKLIYNFIMNGPYVIRMIPEPGDPNREVPVPETFHEQTDDELMKAEIKQMEADDQAIRTILLGLPEDIYAAVDSCETAQEIWLRVQQMMKGSDIGIQEKKAKLFNEWKIFTSTEGESIESYYHRFSKLMNDSKRNKHFPKKIASNLKFLNNLQPEWSRHVTIVHQTKYLYTADYTQLYDFLNVSPKSTIIKYLHTTTITQKQLYLTTIIQPELHTTTYAKSRRHYRPATAMNMELVLMAKAFKLNYSTPTNNHRISSNPRNRQIAHPGMNLGQDNQMQMVGGNGRNQFRQYARQNVGNPAPRAESNANGNNGNQIRCYNCGGLGHPARNCTVMPKRRDVAYLQTRLLIAQKEGAGVQLQAEEFDLMAAAADLDEIDKVNANCILMANLQQASTSGTQTNKALVYDSDGSAENDSNGISKVSSVEQGGGTVEQHSANVEETSAYHESLFHNLTAEVEKVNSVNRKIEETNAELTTKLARYKNQERCFEISQEKYVKLARCYQQSVYQEQCLTKKINALHLISEKLHDTIYENAKLRAQLFDDVSEQKDTTNGTSTNTKFANQSTERKLFLQSLRNKTVVRQPNAFQSERPNFSKTQVPQKVDKTNDLSNPVTSNSVPTTKESKVVENNTVIAPRMFRINPFKNSREVKFVPNKPVNASVRSNPITDPQPHVITKKVFNSDSHGFSSTRVDITTKTRRPQPRSNTKNDRVPSAFKSIRIKNKEVKVEDHLRNLLLYKNKKHMSSECNNIKLAIRNDKSEIIYAMCKQCLITENHDVCVLNYVNGMNSCSKKQKANVFNIANQTKHKEQIWKPKNVGSKERLASPKCTLGTYNQTVSKFHFFSWQVIQICLWCVDSGCSKHMTGNLKLLTNFVWKFLGTVRFGNDHVVAILGFGDLQWENILITRVYFFEGLGHKLFSVGKFCDSDLEVAFKRNTCFVRNLEGVDLLKGNRTINLYTINLHNMASASPICLMARATSTKSCSNTIKIIFFPHVSKEKAKVTSPPPKPDLNSKQRLHFLHMDLCGPMRIASINGKWYVLVIVDDYSRYTWVVFFRSKDEAPEEIKTFFKKITVILQAPVIIVRTDNGTEFKNQVLQEYFKSVGISHQASYICTQQNRVVKRRNRTLVEAARTIKPDISFLHVFGALCYLKNDREDFEKLGAKVVIGFFIGYSANLCAYRVYKRRTKKIMETMNVTFDELSAMAYNRRDLPRNTPLDRVEVLGMIEKKSKVRKERVPTEMELVLEQTQQGISDGVATSFQLSQDSRPHAHDP
uniref:Retrovirus-related Pol polyprotein from transposon TNT 1-94 n=1 Tax=Tanacetum cinerariifolium TaxID=118510 RepID=A0A6L2K9E6_TANCI|nr:hypothetical protein [Tanacetum cinerariifolium]